MACVDTILHIFIGQYSYSPIELQPYIDMALYSYGCVDTILHIVMVLYSYGHTELWPYIVMAPYSYGPI